MEPLYLDPLLRLFRALPAELWHLVPAGLLYQLLTQRVKLVIVEGDVLVPEISMRGHFSVGRPAFFFCFGLFLLGHVFFLGCRENVLAFELSHQLA